MRIIHSAIVLTVCLALVHAHQQQEQPKANTASEVPTASDKQQEQNGPPNEMTPAQIDLARQGISQILAKLPVQQLDPLVTSMDGYCTAFGALCAAACKERVTPENKDGETVRLLVKSLLPNAKQGDFASEGILDILTFIPAVPGFLSVIHVLQNICYYVSFLDVLASNPHPNSSCPISPNGPLGIVSSIPVLGPLLSGLLGGLVKGAPTPTPLPGPFDWLFPPPKKTPTATPTATATPSHVPSIFELIGDLFKPKPVTTTTTATHSATATHTSTATATPKAAAQDIIGTIIEGIEKGFGSSIPHSDNDESVEGVEDGKMDWVSEAAPKAEKVKAKHDGRVSRSARAQRRHAEKIAKEQDRNDL
ncbi:hypothetical protein BGZ72_011001 [Mortierella alpina]|nr:hypothetical protein BGZ72_011001 [Mortierella alpina]